MRRRATEVVLTACAVAVLVGCGSVDHLVYVSETSLGVSVNAAAQGTPKVAVGYDRETLAVVPRVDSACEPKREAMSLVAVSDIGGTMSHMAIVAREYGMPAVVGTGAATKKIKSGQRIRVDGDRGVVTILDEVA